MRAKYAASASTPCLIASARPARRCASGRVRDRLDVGEHGGRRMERADEVLPRGGVHARLAADRGVDHGEQRGGALHDGHAAHERRGDEAREIADDAAAERDDRRVAAAARRRAGRR